MSTRNWRSLVLAHARTTGAADLAPHTVDELASHLEDIYLAAVAEGRSDADAFHAAERALHESPLASVPRSRTRAPESRPWAAGEPPKTWSGLFGDVRFAWRQFKRAPSFAVVAIATLGLGAGAATAIFSVVDAVLLRPLPYRQPQELVAIWENNTEKGLPKERLSPVNLMDYRDVTSVLADIAGWWRPDVSLVEAGTEPFKVSTVETSANLFQLLGVSPQLGPGFPADGSLFARDPVAVISDRLWRQHFSADAQVVGRMLHTNRGNYRIAGVMPPRFTFPDDVDVWMRLQWDFHQHSRAAHFVEAIGRLAPGTSVDEAARELTALSTRLGAEHSATNKGWNARPVALLDDVLGYYRPALFVLVGAVSLLLLTACFNVASLLLARATMRAKEIAVRAALGASRVRLVRQLLVESVLLASAGTIAGAAGASLFLKLAIASMPVAVPRLAETGVDLRLLGFAALTIAGTSIVFGLMPALVLTRTDAAEALRDSGRTATGVRGHRWNRALVVVEVALASAVLLGSALLVQSVMRMLHAPIGIRPDGVVTAGLQLNGAAYPSWEMVEQSYTTLLASIRQQPGIEAAGVSNCLPLEPGWRLAFRLEGQAPARLEDDPQAQHVTVSTGYFEAMGASLVSGRYFADSDATGSEPVVVVNRTFVRQALAGVDPIGRRLMSFANQIGPLGRNLAGRGPFRIVGVVLDVHQAPLGQPSEPVIYYPLRQFPFRATTVAARGRDAAAVTAGLRSAVRQFDASLALADLKTMDDRLKAATTAPRLLMFVLTAFAAMTALLAAVGVYGLLACVVNERRRELAIRLALGARPGALARLVTVQGLGLAIVGVVVGLVAAQLAGGLLKDVLFQTRTTDVAAMTAAGLILLSAAAAACFAPALRAARVTAIEGLKGE